MSVGWTISPSIWLNQTVLIRFFTRATCTCAPEPDQKTNILMLLKLFGKTTSDNRESPRWDLWLQRKRVGRGGEASETLSHHPWPQFQIVIIIFNNMLHFILRFHARSRNLEFCSRVWLRVFLMGFFSFFFLLLKESEQCRCWISFYGTTANASHVFIVHLGGKKCPGAHESSRVGRGGLM